MASESHCTSQATLLNALLSPRWEGDTRPEEVYVYTELIHFCLQQKQTQHCIKQLYFNNFVKKKNKLAQESVTEAT